MRWMESPRSSSWISSAPSSVRAARRVACRAGAVHSQAARLAGALLAVLLYERGETAEAERLLDESFKLGAEEGAVDMIIARFVVGARLAVLRGDRAAAAGFSTKVPISPSDCPLRD